MAQQVDYFDWFITFDCGCWSAKFNWVKLWYCEVITSYSMLMYYYSGNCIQIVLLLLHKLERLTFLKRIIQDHSNGAALKFSLKENFNEVTLLVENWQSISANEIASFRFPPKFFLKKKLIIIVAGKRCDLTPAN